MLHLFNDIVVIGILSALIYIGFKVGKYVYNIMRLPPGPTGLPFIGVINKLDPKDVPGTVQRWKDEYGDLYSFTLAGQSVVVVSKYEWIKEVLLTRSDEFAGRPRSFRFDALFDFHPVVGFTSDSPKIRVLKKALNTSLKMYGERLLKLEDISLDALRDMFEQWRTHDGKPFDPQASVHDVTAKIISSLAYGKPMTEEEFKRDLENQQKISTMVAPGGPGQMLEFLPWLRHFGNKTWPALMDLKNKVDSFFGGLYEDCMGRFDGENAECVAHALVLAQRKMNKENGGREVISDIDVFNQSRTIIGAGTGTTFRATHSFVAILANNPEIQARLQQEVDEAVGAETPRLKDKEKMPYVEATMYELLRYISHVPTLIPHSTMKDTTLGGYPLPKGSQVWINAFGLHHDPRYWDDAWEFKPERYLDEDGKLVASDHPNRRRLLSFGAGRRFCSGEVLAKNRLFLIMSGIVQNFTVRPKSDSERPDHDPRNYRPGLITHPNDYQVCAIPRNL